MWRFFLSHGMSWAYPQAPSSISNDGILHEINHRGSPMPMETPICQELDVGKLLPAWRLIFFGPEWFVAMDSKNRCPENLSELPGHENMDQLKKKNVRCHHMISWYRWCFNMVSSRLSSAVFGVRKYHRPARLAEMWSSTDQYVRHFFPSHGGIPKSSKSRMTLN